MIINMWFKREPKLSCFVFQRKTQGSSKIELLNYISLRNISLYVYLCLKKRKFKFDFTVNFHIYCSCYKNIEDKLAKMLKLEKMSLSFINIVYCNNLPSFDMLTKFPSHNSLCWQLVENYIISVAKISLDALESLGSNLVLCIGWGMIDFLQ